MALEPGARVAHYEIISSIGAGGMGEVYRARDTKLERDVAVKVLPEELAADGERIARFEREAKLLASLNHPNIASIHGFEDSDGVKALILELVEGPTLAERIVAGPIPLEETLRIAKQIADALEAGHAEGVIHRDLKPANIKLKEDGTVKVLDYGLAKALGGDAPSRGDSELSRSPTLTMQGTQVGVVLGTAAYMSPEQAKGKRVDKRADVWAFGAVVYEMLSGKRAFGGEDVSDTLAAVLRGEPDLDALPSTTEDHVRCAIELCLKKDLKDRARDIGDVALALQGRFGAGGFPAETSPRRSWAFVLASAAATALVVGGLAWFFFGAEPSAGVMRFETDSGQLGPVPGHFIRISPDGETLLYTKREGHSSRLYQRSLDMTEPRPIPGTEGVYNVFVSPDGRWAGFVNGLALQKVRLDGGERITLCRCPGVRGVSWGDNGEIVLGTVGGLSRLSENGGDPEPMTEPPSGSSHIRPSHLPGGRGILLTVWTGASGTGEVAVLEPGSREPRVLLPGTSPQYAPSGHLVYQRDGSLWAVSFDLGALELVGSPVPVLQGVYVSGNGAAQFDVAETGTMIHVPSGDPESDVSLFWMDRGGEATVALERYDGSIFPTLAPNGRYVAAAERNSGALILFDLEQGSRRQLAGRVNLRIAWSPDGHRIAHTDSDSSELRAIDIEAAGSRIETLGPIEDMEPHSWSPDGNRIAFERRGDIWLAEIGGEQTPLFETPVRDTDVAFSPDGRLLAFAGNVIGGVGDIVVVNLESTERWTVSTGAGKAPFWARDGNELFWTENLPARLMAVDVRLAPSVSFGQARVVLDELELGGIDVISVAGISSDNERFLLLNQGDVLAQSLSRGLVVTLNWTVELKELATMH